MEKVYTFEICYEGDNFGVIQFCAATMAEARALFNYWCTEDEELETPYEVTSVEVVYDEDDAVEYGALYGTPDEYFREVA